MPRPARNHSRRQLLIAAAVLSALTVSVPLRMTASRAQLSEFLRFFKGAQDPFPGDNIQPFDCGPDAVRVGNACVKRDGDGGKDGGSGGRQCPTAECTVPPPGCTYANPGRLLPNGCHQQCELVCAQGGGDPRAGGDTGKKEGDIGIYDCPPGMAGVPVINGQPCGGGMPTLPDPASAAAGMDGWRMDGGLPQMQPAISADPLTYPAAMDMYVFPSAENTMSAPSSFDPAATDWTMEWSAPAATDPLAGMRGAAPAMTDGGMPAGEGWFSGGMAPDTGMPSAMPSPSYEVQPAFPGMTDPGRETWSAGREPLHAAPGSMEYGADAGSAQGMMGAQQLSGATGNGGAAGMQGGDSCAPGVCYTGGALPCGAPSALQQDGAMRTCNGNAGICMQCPAGQDAATGGITQATGAGNGSVAPQAQWQQEQGGAKGLGVCGDGAVGRGEQCDDGGANGTARSECSSDCKSLAAQRQADVCDRCGELSEGDCNATASRCIWFSQRNRCEKGMQCGASAQLNSCGCNGRTREQCAAPCAWNNGCVQDDAICPALRQSCPNLCEYTATFSRPQLTTDAAGRFAAFTMNKRTAGVNQFAFVVDAGGAGTVGAARTRIAFNTGGPQQSQAAHLSLSPSGGQLLYSTYGGYMPSGSVRRYDAPRNADFPVLSGGFPSAGAEGKTAFIGYDRCLRIHDWTTGDTTDTRVCEVEDLAMNAGGAIAYFWQDYFRRQPMELRLLRGAGGTPVRLAAGRTLLQMGHNAGPGKLYFNAAGQLGLMLQEDGVNVSYVWDSAADTGRRVSVTTMRILGLADNGSVLTMERDAASFRNQKLQVIAADGTRVTLASSEGSLESTWGNVTGALSADGNVAYAWLPGSNVQELQLVRFTLGAGASSRVVFSPEDGKCAEATPACN